MIKRLLLLGVLLSSAACAVAAKTQPPQLEPQIQPVPLPPANDEQPMVKFRWWAPDNVLVCFEKRYAPEHPICFTMKELRAWVDRQEKT